MRIPSSGRPLLLVPVVLCALLAGGAVRIVQDQCGVFTDVSPEFCPFVLEIYALGITAGTSPTTFSPDDPLTRGQAAVFIGKTMNQTFTRGSRRIALGQTWALQPGGLWPDDRGTTVVDDSPASPAGDGQDIWVPSLSSGTVSRVRASDGRLLERWTGAESPSAVLVAAGRVYVTGRTTPGKLYEIDPRVPAGEVTLVSSELGEEPIAITFDGTKIWTTNQGMQPGGTPSVSNILPGSWSVSTNTAGFVHPVGMVFDGRNTWVADGNYILKLDDFGQVLQTVAVNGGAVGRPAFDGKNILVPAAPTTIAAIDPDTGYVVGGVQGGGIDNPIAAAYDGERVLVLNTGGTFALFRATDYSVLSFGYLNNLPYGACSDGVNFWVTMNTTPGKLGRY